MTGYFNMRRLIIVNECTFFIDYHKGTGSKITQVKCFCCVSNRFSENRIFVWTLYFVHTKIHMATGQSAGFTKKQSENRIDLATDMSHYTQTEL